MHTYMHAFILLSLSPAQAGERVPKAGEGMNEAEIPPLSSYCRARRPLTPTLSPASGGEGAVPVHSQ